MTTLERHCQLLLLAYPAAYREVRGDEIVGTLLEVTPPERSWPWPRDSRGLILGGLRARATFNRRLTTGANLRTALLAGIAGYLAYNAVASGTVYVLARIGFDGHAVSAPFGWPILLASALVLLAVALVCLNGGRALVLAAGLPAGALVCYAGPWAPGGYMVIHLVFLAALLALVALPGGRRMSRRWLVGVGVLAVLPVLPYFGRGSGTVLYGVLLLTIGAVSIVWAVIDARPAVAVIAFLTVFYLPILASDLARGAFPLFVLPYVGVLTVLAVPALWLLRRQSAHAGRPTRA